MFKFFVALKREFISCLETLNYSRLLNLSFNKLVLQAILLKFLIQNFNLSYY